MVSIAGLVWNSSNARVTSLAENALAFVCDTI